jgi:hypothetical protein
MEDLILKIREVENGYVLKWEDEDEDDDGNITWQEHRHVIQEDDDGGDELVHHEQLLWFVMEFFGFGGSKHDPERLRIIRDPHKLT